MNALAGKCAVAKKKCKKVFCFSYLKCFSEAYLKLNNELQ